MAIRNQLPELEMLKTVWPQRWFLVKKALEKDKAPYLDFEKYQAFCRLQGITEEQVQEILVGFLHDLGVAIHFPDFELLDTYVLDPLWVTGAVYRIINNPELVHANGVLALKRLPEILKKRELTDFTYPLAKHPYIINIMKKFELCYSLPQDRVLVPDLLPVQEPALDYDEDGAFRCRVTYEFLPRTVMPRFIVKRHAQIDGNLQWRTGVVLRHKDNHARAVIRADYEDRFIEILVSGPLKRDFFALIRETLREINDGFQKNVIRETIACNCQTCLAEEIPEFHDYQKMLRFFAKGYRDWPCPNSEEMISIPQLLGEVLGTQEADIRKVLKMIQELNEKGDPPSTLVKNLQNAGAGASIVALAREFIRIFFGV